MTTQPAASIRPRINLTAVSELTQLADYTIAFTIRAVAQLGVADALADGPKTIDEIAERVGAHAPSLLRALRALTTHDIFGEPSQGTFALTPRADLLRSDHPLSLQHAFRTQPDLAAWGEMAYSLRTGQPSFDHHYGRTYWEQLAVDPTVRDEFLRSQSAMSTVESQLITRCYPWSEVGTMVDLGGNDGTFVAHLLRSFPHLQGTVVDLPGTIERAGSTLAEHGVSDRATIRSANLLTDPLPAGADLYTVKRVLIGFSDDEITRFGHRLVEVLAPRSRLMILEPRDTGDAMRAAMDLHMLVLGTGRVRSSDEFARLLAPTGLEVATVTDAHLLTMIVLQRQDPPA